MFNSIFVRPYTGYGDWISVNGLIRFLSSKYKEVNLIYDGMSDEFIKNLYRDDNKIKTIDYYQVQLNSNLDWDYLDLQTARQSPPPSSNFYNIFNPIGKKFGLPVHDLKDEWFHPQFLIDPTESAKFSEESKNILENNASAFYVSAGIPTNYRIDNFYYQRDLDSENKFFNDLNLPQKYVVISEYGENLIDRQFIKNKDVPLININNISPKYFDIIKVIENAEEVHLIENSTALLIYHMQYKKLMDSIEINLHTYARKEMVRKCISKDESNIFLDMMRFPELENWKFIYQENVN
jgi:hypothetical protein